MYGFLAIDESTFRNLYPLLIRYKYSSMTRITTVNPCSYFRILLRINVKLPIAKMIQKMWNNCSCPQHRSYGVDTDRSSNQRSATLYWYPIITYINYFLLLLKVIWYNIVCLSESGSVIAPAGYARNNCATVLLALLSCL